MAVAFAGFSIREYASKMRIADVATSWPFGGESDDEVRKEDVEASLPPITVKKFRWWSDELDLGRSDEARQNIYGETSEPSCVEAEKMEVALELSETVLGSNGEKLDVEQPETKMKRSRGPKKRSIVEIFAVAPQVERVDADDADDKEEEEEEEEENEVYNSKVLALCDVVRDLQMKEKMNKKKKPKLDDQTVGKVKKQKKMSIVKKKGPKKGLHCLDRLVKSIAKKVKPQKLKLQSRFTFTAKPDGSFCSEGSGKDILDAVYVHDKPRVKCPATKKNQKLLQTSKLIKHQKTVFPVRGILKNHKKGFLGEHSTVCNSQIASQLNHFGVPQSDRHVRFSDKDDILGPGPGPRRRPSIECSELQNVSSVKDNAIQSGKALAIPEVNGSDEDASFRTKNEREFCPASERQSCDTRFLDIPNFLRLHVGGQEHLSDGPVTVNQVGLRSQSLQTFKQGFRDASHELLYDDPSTRFLSLLKEGYNPFLNTQASPDILRASHPSERLDEFQSNPYFANGKLPCRSQNTTVNYPGHSMQYQPFVHFTPKELMKSICSLPNMKQRAVMGDERHIYEGFCGLPLNSQGELIQLSSSGKDVFSHLIRPTSIVTGSSRSLAAHYTLKNSAADLSNSRDRNCGGGNVFPVGVYGKENPNLIQDTGKTDVHCSGENNRSVYQGESDLELMEMSHRVQKQDNKVQDQIGEEKGPPTMRLMGKEFTVGRSSKDLQASEDGKVWTDKQIIAEHRPANTIVDSFSIKRQFQQDLLSHLASGKSKENVAWLSETQINKASQSAAQMKPPGFSFSHPYFNCKTDIGYPNSYQAINGNRFSKLPQYIPSVGSPPLFSQAPLFPEQFVSGYESLKPDSQTPIFSSTPRGNMNSIPVELSKSAFEIPFLHPKCGEQIQPSWFQNSDRSLPPWLLTATQQKETLLGSCQSYTNVVSRHHSPTMYNPVQHAPELPYPYISPSFSHSTVHSSLRPPVMPLCREFMPTSPTNKIHGSRVKFRERMGGKEPDQGKKTRKRPAAKSLDSPKPTKIPNLTVQEDFNSETALWASIAALELEPNREKASSLECGQTEIGMDGLRDSPVMETLKMDGIARSGPVRLSAGTKHILKPGSNVNNQDNSRPTHSTIPFDESTSSARVSESETRTAQIYRF